MNRKLTVLAGIIGIMMILYSCEIPTKIKITVDHDMDLATKVGSANMVSMLTSSLKDSFPEEFKLYELEKYESNRKKVMAFLVGYKMDLSDSFNPDDALGNVGLTDLNQAIEEGMQTNIPRINETMAIPSMAPAPIAQTINVPLGNLFTQITDRMNSAGATFPVEVPLRVIGGGTSITSDMLEFPPIDPFNLDRDSDDPNNPFSFGSLQFASGEMKLKLELVSTGGGTPPPGISITLNGIGLDYESAPIDENGVPLSTILAEGSPATVQLTSAAPTREVTINLAGKDIYKDNRAKFRVSGIRDDSNVIYIGTQYTLKITPRLENTQFRGAKDIRRFSFTQDLPANAFPSEINMGIGGAGTEGFKHAEIKTGNLGIVATMPAGTYGSPTVSKFNEFDVSFELYIQQPDSDPAPGVPSYHGLGYEGPTQTTPGVWKMIKNNDTSDVSLAGKHINPKPLRILTAGSYPSKVIIEAGTNLTDSLGNPRGVSFSLSDADRVSGTIQVPMRMEMSIQELETVHWDIGNTFTMPDIAPISLADAAKYAESISFDGATPNTDTDGIGIKIHFESLPLRNTQLQITCNEDGFHFPTGQTLTQGGDIFYKNTQPAVLLLPDYRETRTNQKMLQFDINLEPVGGGSVVELGPLAVGESLRINGEFHFFQHWTEAKINVSEAMAASGTDLSALEGVFPDTAKGQDPVDLSVMGDYMEGFQLEGIRAKLFLSGPAGILNTFNSLPGAALGLEFDAQSSTLPEGSLSLYGGGLVMGPMTEDLEQWAKTETTLPDGGLSFNDGAFSNLLSRNPPDLGFTYKLKLPDGTITVTPETFNSLENSSSDNNFSVYIMLLMPLELKAGENGATIKLPKDMFGKEAAAEEKDLFGREKLGDYCWGNLDGLDVKKVLLTIEMNDPVFDGGSMKIDKNNKLFPNGLPLKGSGIGLTLTGADMKIARENLVYPDVRIEFPKDTMVRVPRDLLPTRIKLAVSGSYTMDIK